MKDIATTMLVAAGLLWQSADASADSKQGGVMTHVPQQQQQQGQSPNTPATMTHIDPGQFTQDAKDVPQIDPGKVPSPGRHAAPVVPETAPPPGPDVTGFQTPDHLLDDMHGGRLPGDDARFRESVRDLFGDAETIRDVPGMAGSEVDPLDMLGGRPDGKLDEMLGENQGGRGLDEADFMPTPTTPRQTPQNARGGPDRAPVTPGSPRDAMGGAASQDYGRVVRREDDGGYTTRSDEQNLRGTQTTTYRRYDADGTFRGASQHATHRDGSTTEMHSHVDPDGRTHIQRTHTNGDRREVIDTVYNPDGTVRSERVRVNDEDIAGMPRDDGDGDGAWALWHYRNLYHGPKDTGIQDPNRGPPPGGEEGADHGPPSTGIDLGDDIVINPDPVNAAGAGGGQLPRALDPSEIGQGKTPGGYTPDDRGNQ